MLETICEMHFPPVYCSDLGHCYAFLRFVCVFSYFVYLNDEFFLLSNHNPLFDLIFFFPFSSLEYITIPAMD